MVTTVPRGSTYARERMKELGVDTTAIDPGNGNFGYRCVVVDTLPTNAEMEENTLYFVRESTP